MADHEQDLAAAGDRHRQAAEERHLAARQLEQAVLAARPLLTPSKIAELAGVSRQTVHTIMRSKENR